MYLNTTSRRHSNDDKNKREYAILTINSLNDRNFMAILEDEPEIGNYLRTNVDGITTREENIRYVKETGRLSATSKEVTAIMKSDDKTIIKYLCTLDDKTLLKLAKDSTIQEGIKENPSLEQRYKSILSSREEDGTKIIIVENAVTDLIETRQNTMNSIKKSPPQHLTSDRTLTPVSFSLSSIND